MARVKLSGVVSGASGSIAGSTFHSDLSGLRIINKSFRNNFQNFRSNRGKVATYTVAKRWRTLTEAQRRQWNLFSYKGRKGYDLYRACNVQRARLGLTLLTVPVVPRAIPRRVEPWSISINPGGAISFTLRFTNVLAFCNIVISVSHARGSRRSVKSQTFRFTSQAAIMSVFNGAISNTDYTNIIGYPIPPKYWITVKIQLVDTTNGYVSPVWYLQAQRP